MPLTVWKCLLNIEDEHVLEIPSPAITLSFQVQNGALVLWFLVNPELGKVTKVFRLAGTGHQINNSLSELEYIDTVQLKGGKLVYHLFEILH